jgi:hypothetical protein
MARSSLLLLALLPLLKLMRPRAPLWSLLSSSPLLLPLASDTGE